MLNKNSSLFSDPVEGLKFSLYKGIVLGPEVNNCVLSEDEEQVISNHRIFNSIMLEYLSQNLFLHRLPLNGEIGMYIVREVASSFTFVSNCLTKVIN